MLRLAQPTPDTFDMLKKADGHGNAMKSHEKPHNHALRPKWTKGKPLCFPLPRSSRKPYGMTCHRPPRSNSLC